MPLCQKRVPPLDQGSVLLHLDVRDLPLERGEQFPSTHSGPEAAEAWD